MSSTASCACCASTTASCSTRYSNAAASSASRVIAVHKAMPLGPVQMDPFRNGDVDYAAIDFPDLAFEVVHSGLAFLDEAALQIARFPNVYVGLESTAALAVRHPRKFARILREFLLAGGARKLFRASGASSPQPRPVA